MYNINDMYGQANIGSLDERVAILKQQDKAYKHLEREMKIIITDEAHQFHSAGHALYQRLFLLPNTDGLREKLFTLLDEVSEVVDEIREAMPLTVE